MKTFLFAVLTASLFSINVANANIATLGTTNVEITSASAGKFFVLNLNHLDANAPINVKLEAESGETLRA